MIALSKNTLRLTEALFSEDLRETAAQILIYSCAENLPLISNPTPQSLERIRFAALKLSDGEIAKLQRAIEIAATDWRDLLVAAGFGDDTRAHENWAKEILRKF